MKTVQILGQPVPLKPPKSRTICYEVWAHGGTNPTRAFAAALGVCVVPAALPQKGEPPRPVLTAKYRGEVASYGAQVMDELCEHGMTPMQVQAAGAVAYSLLAEIAAPLPSEPEVEEAAGPFVEPGGTS